MVALAAIQPGEAKELQWGRGQASGKEAAKTSAKLQFVRPQIASRRIDSSVQPATFEDDPQPPSTHVDDVQTRSVVVGRDSDEPLRSAQLPANIETKLPDTGAPAPPSGTSIDSQLNKDLRAPFGELPEGPPKLETPDLEMPPVPREETPQSPVERQPAQIPPPVDQQPTTSAPAGQQRPQPNAGQFQPVLPSGPTPQEATVPPVPVPATAPATIQAEGTKAKESCEKSLENLRAYTVDKVKLNIAVTGTEGEDYPFECSIDDGTQHNGRCWDQTTYQWKASALCHKPLYFEDEQLERYGHSFSPCFQPFVSGAHFFTRLPVLPYCMGVEPPCECIYALGHYRPGSCAPYMINPVPISPRGALFEAGAVWGAAAILP
jgi:hypothetical protein